MSRTNENKLKMKDIATIGIFSALLFVVTIPLNIIFHIFEGNHRLELAKSAF